MTPLPAFRDTRERSIYIQAALRTAGLSFASIARQHGWSRRAVANAMTNASYPQEQAIAAALCLDPIELFPERYDESGRRLHHVREISPQNIPRNVKNQRVA